MFNPRFLMFITHYLCRPVACRPRRPETKGKVERPFQYIESSLLNARTFDSLDDLRAHARCRSEAVVYFETNRYSIPYANIGQILTLRVTETEVVIYDPLLFELGRHERLPDGARLKTELDEHRQS